jgi:DegV family protein with EDD domain
MPRVRIVTDSTCDLPPELVHQYGIQVVPLYVNINGETYLDRVDISTEEFHRRLAAWPSGQDLPTTSHPAVETFEELYKKILKDGDSIISIHHSSKLGSTYQTAVQARNNILAPTTQVTVIDSQSASLGLGFIALEAAKRAKQGVMHSELVSSVNRMVFQTHVIFFTETMQHLQQSGRINSKAQQALGPTPPSNFRPLLRLEEGLIVPFERTRTRTKAIEGLCEFIEDFPYIEEMAIMHSNSPNDIETILTRIAPIFPREKVYIAQFSPVLATHLGPGAMGVAVYEGGVF